MQINAKHSVVGNCGQRYEVCYFFLSTYLVFILLTFVDLKISSSLDPLTSFEHARSAYSSCFYRFKSDWHSILSLLLITHLARISLPFECLKSYQCWILSLFLQQPKLFWFWLHLHTSLDFSSLIYYDTSSCCKSTRLLLINPKNMGISHEFQISLLIFTLEF